MDISQIAAVLDAAAMNAAPVAQFDPEGRMALAEAYAVQSASVQRRIARGERRVGVKMGFTSRAKMVQMGIQDVIWGRLTSAMQVEEGASAPAAMFIRPRVEPEIAFLLKRDLPGGASAPEALAAVEAIAPALEIIDSRFQDFKFTLPEVIADNASSSGFVLGPWNDPRQDFANLGLIVTIDGRPVQFGSTAALLGHPLRSLVAAARLSAEAGEPLRAGAIVMAGGATPAEWIGRGQCVRVEMERLGVAAFSLQ